MVAYTFLMITLMPTFISGKTVYPIELIIGTFVIISPYIIVVFIYKT